MHKIQSSASELKVFQNTSIIIPTAKITSLYISTDLTLFLPQTKYPLHELQSYFAHFMEKIVLFQYVAKFPHFPAVFARLKCLCKTN